MESTVSDHSHPPWWSEITGTKGSELVLTHSHQWGFFFFLQCSVAMCCVWSHSLDLTSKKCWLCEFFVWSCTVEQLEDSSVRIFLGNSLPSVPVLLHLFYFWAFDTLFTASSHFGQCKASATKNAILDRASLLLHMWVWKCKSALTKLSHLQSCKSATSVPTSSFHHHLCKAKQSNFYTLFEHKINKNIHIIMSVETGGLCFNGVAPDPCWGEMPALCRPS